MKIIRLDSLEKIYNLLSLSGVDKSDDFVIFMLSKKIERIIEQKELAVKKRNYEKAADLRFQEIKSLKKIIEKVKLNFKMKNSVLNLIVDFDWLNKEFKHITKNET